MSDFDCDERENELSHQVFMNTHTPPKVSLAEPEPQSFSHVQGLLGDLENEHDDGDEGFGLKLTEVNSANNSLAKEMESLSLEANPSSSAPDRN